MYSLYKDKLGVKANFKKAISSSVMAVTGTGVGHFICKAIVDNFSEVNSAEDGIGMATIITGLVVLGGIDYAASNISDYRYYKKDYQASVRYFKEKNSGKFNSVNAYIKSYFIDNETLASLSNEDLDELIEEISILFNMEQERTKVEKKILKLKRKQIEAQRRQYDDELDKIDKIIDIASIERRR